jgi:hypothetical protein
MGWREKVELLAHVVLLLAGRATSVKSAVGLRFGRWLCADSVLNINDGIAGCAGIINARILQIQNELIPMGHSSRASGARGDALKTKKTL